MYAGFARSPNPADDCQLATRYGGSSDQYFCVRIFTPRETGNCHSCGAHDLREHIDPLHSVRTINSIIEVTDLL
jgi:hypothetical protein